MRYKNGKCSECGNAVDEATLPYYYRCLYCGMFFHIFIYED